MKLKPWLFALIEQHLAEDVREAAREWLKKHVVTYRAVQLLDDDDTPSR